MIDSTAARKSKPYKAQSIFGAQRRVRKMVAELERSEFRLRDLFIECELLQHERRELAKLAATGPAFFNPLWAMEAEKIRDRVLRELGMNPDGSFIK